MLRVSAAVNSCMCYSFVGLCVLLVSFDAFLCEDASMADTIILMSTDINPLPKRVITSKQHPVQPRSRRCRHFHPFFETFAWQICRHEFSSAFCTASNTRINFSLLTGCCTRSSQALSCDHASILQCISACTVIVHCWFHCAGRQLFICPAVS